MEVDANGKPVTSASTDAAGKGSKGSEIPKELQKFIDPATNQVDFSKVAQSISEAEKKISETSREKAATEAAYKELAVRVGGGSEAAAKPSGDVRASGRKISVEDVAENPDAAIRGAAAETFAALAQPVVDDILAIAHPEIAQVGIDDEGKPVYRDPDFVKGLRAFVATLPPGMKQSLGDLRSAKYVITLYKQLKQEKADAEKNATRETAETKKTNFSESAKQPSKSSTGGKIWKRSEIREMIARRPEEYSRREAEIDAAYAEDRVDLDH